MYGAKFYKACLLQLSFMIIAASDTLPTPLSMFRWRYRTDSKCPLCRNHFPTTKHILNACPIALSGDHRCFRDMENPPSTVPIEILPNSDRSDIIFVSKDKEITIIELKVPFNSPDCINAAHGYKFSKYQLLLSDQGANTNPLSSLR